jgi:hypothetical protein
MVLDAISRWENEGGAVQPAFVRLDGAAPAEKPAKLKRPADGLADADATRRRRLLLRRLSKS